MTITKIEFIAPPASARLVLESAFRDQIDSGRGKNEKLSLLKGMIFSVLASRDDVLLKASRGETVYPDILACAITEAITLTDIVKEFLTLPEGISNVGSISNWNEIFQRGVKASSEIAVSRMGFALEAIKMEEAIVTPPAKPELASGLGNVKNVLCWLAAIGCLLALADLPSEFYKILRFIVVAACVAIIWEAQKSEANEKKKTAVSMAFGLLAVIFNPILPIEMARGAWAWVDVSAALMFGWSFLRGEQRFVEHVLCAWSALWVSNNSEEGEFHHFKAGFNDLRFARHHLELNIYKGRKEPDVVIKCTWVMNFLAWASGGIPCAEDYLEKRKEFHEKAFGEWIGENALFEKIRDAVNSSQNGIVKIGNVSLDLAINAPMK